MQANSSRKIENFLASPAGERFRKLAGMLASGYRGERANAADMATKLLVEHELTWAEVMGQAPAPSGGGQSTRINDLEYRLRIEQENYQKLFKTNTKLRRDIDALEAALRKLAHESVHERIKKLEDENAHLKMTIAKANGPAGGTKYHNGEDPAPNQSTSHKPRVYATKLQKQINEAIDEIEGAIELSDWEQQFCASVRELKYKLSPKQAARLTMLAKQANLDVVFEATG